jgi:hydrogenase small subunit
MAESERSSPIMGVSRREFIAYCSFVCATIGLGEAAVPELAMALEKLVKRPNVIWSCMGECLGCSVSLLQNTTPTVPQLVLRTISLNYHEAVMAPAGFEAEKSLNETIAGKDYYWVVEGAIPTTPPEACMIAGRTAGDLSVELYKNAKAAIATGSCACNGNVQAAAPNPTGSMGVQQYLREKGGIADATLINMSRCPGNGDDLIMALSYVLVTGKVPELDSQGRPLILYGQTIHENCERRGHFDAGEFAETFGDAGWDKGWCLFKVGCKGPETYAPCPKTRWNDRVSWCVHNGPCTGCSEAGFWDKFTPFNKPLNTVTVPGAGPVNATTLGVGLVGLTAVGLGAHFIGQVATGRLGKGGVSGDEPKGDAGKGGDA